ncbi:MAG: hypothetical protein H0X51_08980 [Parachlamydiaceae bacterium]|nr:hypothetical protein [Parachlamydiaceae bacterium]
MSFITEGVRSLFSGAASTVSSVDDHSSYSTFSTFSSFRAASKAEKQLVKAEPKQKPYPVVADCLGHLFSFLSIPELAAADRVSKEWQHVCTSDPDLQQFRNLTRLIFQQDNTRLVAWQINEFGERVHSVPFVGTMTSVVSEEETKEAAGTLSFSRTSAKKAAKDGKTVAFVIKEIWGDTRKTNKKVGWFGFSLDFYPDSIYSRRGVKLQYSAEPALAKYTKMAQRATDQVNTLIRRQAERDAKAEAEKAQRSTFSSFSDSY